MKKRKSALLCALLALCLTLSACAAPQSAPDNRRERILSVLDDEPTLVDPQRMTEEYNVPLNVFDRLVETREEDDGYVLEPSLAESWELSEDGLVYTFRLRENVRFSNGSELTAQDVGYTLRRMLTHPDSRHRNLALPIKGAQALCDGTADRLDGFRILSPLHFTITLERPCAPFLEGLSTPGASILDQQSTEAAGERFGNSPRTTVGTGPFCFAEWKRGEEILLRANPDCWSGAPRCDGLRLVFSGEHAPMLSMYLDGELDLLDLDQVGMEAEYLLQGDKYRKNLVRGPRVGITYIALNESVEPLNDVRVRKALQIALDRNAILRAAAAGRGVLENGILPRGLMGHNPDLPELPYDPEGAEALLKEAGLEEGFELELNCSASASQSTRDILTLAQVMWERVGVRCRLKELEDEVFLSRRRAGTLSCYTGTWSADYNDPDNFFDTFFGSAQRSRERSLCYADEAVMERVRQARAIIDQEARIAEYRALEEKIIQEDAAWVPLYEKLHFFAVSDRVEGFQVSWNGWSSTRYADVALLDETL